MAWIFPPSQTTTVDIGSANGVLVQKGVALSVADIGISGAGNSQQALIYGWVGGATVGISFGTGASNAETIYVDDDARVTGGVYAMLLLGGNASLVNHGEIVSLSDVALFLGADHAASVTASVVNTGAISGQYIIGRNDLTDPNLITLDNSGTITASVDFFYATSNNAAYHITNSGKIDATMTFSGGEDIYDGANGDVTGAVFGGAGADQLTGGTENNTFDGGTGIDSLTGGRGADTLTGGTEADTFLFRTVADSTLKAAGRDTIADFSLADGDTLDLHLIDANLTRSKNQAFSFIGTHAFDHVAGELRAHATATDTMVFGDVNGDGKADFAIHLQGALTLAAADFAL